MRCLYLAILASALVGISIFGIPDLGIGLDTHPQFSIAQNRADFAHSAVMLVLFLQAGAILVLTPAYLGSAFTEEWERKTLPFLFVTTLRDHELVLGKLFGRLALLGTVLIVGLPVLGGCLAYGPVEFSLVVNGIAASALTLLSTGSVSILCSVWSRTTQEAVLRSYCLILLIGIFCIGRSPISPVLFVAYCEKQVATEWNNWEKDRAINLPTYQREPRTSVQANIRALGTLRLLKFAKPNSVNIRLNALVPYTVVHGLIFLFCVALSIWVVRKTRLSSDDTFPSPASPAARIHFQKPLPASVAHHAGPWHNVSIGPRPPVKDPALLWKEMELGDVRLPASAVGSLPTLTPWRTRVLLGVVAVIALAWYFRSSDPKEHIADFDAGPATMIGYASVIGMGIWTLLLSFRVAGSITREREQGTLQNLLTMPVERDEILRAKWLGSILRFGRSGYVLVGMWVLGIITGSLHPLSLFLLVTAGTIYLSFLSAVGLWISLVSRSTLWAHLSMALLLMLCFSLAIAKLMANTLENNYHHQPLLCRVPEALVDPSYVIVVSAFSWQAMEDALESMEGAFQREAATRGTEPYGGSFLQNLIMIPVNLVFFAFMGWVFWRLSRRKFRSVSC